VHDVVVFVQVVLVQDLKKKSKRGLNAALREKSKKKKAIIAIPKS